MGAYNYILTVIDVFSKYAWAVPVKRKTGEEISNAFEKIFKERTPTKLHRDKGLEFINNPLRNCLRKITFTGLLLKMRPKHKLLRDLTGR